YGFNVGGPFPLPRFGEGGPVLTEKNKLFFYFFYEYTDTTQDFTPNRTVLLGGARTGTFTYLPSCTAENGDTSKPVADRCPVGIHPNTPTSVNLLALTGRTI